MSPVVAEVCTKMYTSTENVMVDDNDDFMFTMNFVNMENHQLSPDSMVTNFEASEEGDYEQDVNEILKLSEVIESMEPYYIHNTLFKCSADINVKCGKVQ